MHHQRNNGGGVQARRPREYGSRGGGNLTRSNTSGRGCALQKAAAVLHPEQNNSDWRRWDQNHGHILWMGNLQDDWNIATIAGFFRYYGAEITVARKGRDSYCFVEFASAEEAKNFMAKYNNQPLPGKLGNNNRFNIRPRTRPWWYQGAEQHSSRTNGVHGRGGGVRDSRGPRLETRNDERVGRKRHQFLEVKTQRRSPQSHQSYQGRGVGSNRPGDTGYYGPRKGDSHRGGREGRTARVTPVSQQRAVPEHDFKRRVDHEQHCKAPPGGHFRSRSWSRSRPQLRQRSRSGSPPPRHNSGKRLRSTSSGKDQSSTQTRKRRYDPPLKQSPAPSSGRGSRWAPSTSATTARSSSRGDASLVQGRGRRFPQTTERSVSPVDSDRMNGRDGAEQNLTPANSSRDFVVGFNGSTTSRRSDIESEKRGGERLLGGGAERAGSHGAETTTTGSSGEQATLPLNVRSSGLDRGDTFEEHPGWKDGPPSDDDSSGRRRQRLGDGVDNDEKTAITTHAWEAAAPVHGGTQCLESSPRSRSNGSPEGRMTTSSSNRYHHRGNREDVETTFDEVSREESLRASPSGALPLPSSTASPPRFQPPQRSSQQQAGTCAARTTSSDRSFGDARGGPIQPNEGFKEGSTTESACDASQISNDSGPDDDSGNDVGRDEDTLPSNGSTGPSPGVIPSAGDKVDERSSDRDVEQIISPPARTGTKPQSTAGITLAQVIDHHMSRRRLNEGAYYHERIQAEGNSSGPNASSGEHMASADLRSKNHYHVSGSWPSAGAGSCAASTPGPSPDCSAVVAAAWTNGSVLALTEVVAPHMRLVAPVLAAEPEGRRIVVQTVAAVAAGAAILALPDYHSEVTGTCRDGILLELRPKEDGAPCAKSLDRREAPTSPFAVAGRLQTAFDGLVKLDLEFDTVQLPHDEAVDIMGIDSSSAELMQWLNEGATKLVRFSAPRTPPPQQPPTGAPPTGEAPSGRYLIELKKTLSRPSGTPLLGIDCNLWPFMPRTGLLASFGVGIHTIVLPSPEPALGGSQANRSVIHLMVTLSDSGTSVGSRGAPLGGLRGSGCHSIRVNPGLEAASLEVAGARGTTGSVVTSDATAVDHPQPAAGPLRCVPPTCTAGGLTWRHVTGLRCVAAVNKLALGSRKEVEGKLQIAERLHAAEIEGLAEKVTGFPGVLLVIVAGRQGASADVIASRLCVELRIKGRKPAMLDTRNYRWDGATQGQVAEEGGAEDPMSISSTHASHHRLDSAALDTAISTLLGKARSEASSSVAKSGGSRAARGERDVAGVGAAARGRQWCDMVVVHGREVLDIELLQPGKFGLGPAEAVSVFVDLVPQVCVDNLTPVNGVDVRLLRSLLDAHASFTKASEAVATGYDGTDYEGGSDTCGHSSFFNTHNFLEEWLAGEEREETLCRSFRPASNVLLNTALPYDLHVLKPVAEPLLRSVPPPTKGSRNSSGGGDGCRSSTYALSRSILRLLRLCEALQAPSVPAASVLSGLTRSIP